MPGQDERVGWTTVESRDYAPTYDQIAEQRRKIEEGQNASKMIDVALSDTQFLAGGKRVFDRHFQDFQPEEGFSITPEQHSEIRLEFGDEQAKEITEGVKSTGELNSRLGWNREDIKRHKELSSYGLAGIGAALVSSVLDPVGWAMSVASGPLAGGVKVTQISRVARLAAIAGIENAALETALYAGDTQKGVDDVFYAGLAGGVMGGTIGALTRARVKPEPTLADDIVPDFEGKPSMPKGDSDLAHVVDGADMFDDFARKAMRDAAEYDAWQAARANTTPAEFDSKIAISDKIDELSTAANVRPSRLEKVSLKRDLAEAEERLAFLKQSQIDERASVAAKRGAPSSTGEALNLRVASGAATSRYADDITAISRQIEGMRAKQESWDNVNAAKVELKRFSNLTPDKQAEELGLARKFEDFNVKEHAANAIKEARAARKPRVVEEAVPEELSNTLDKTTAEPVNTFAPVDDSVGAARVKGSDVEHEMFDLSTNMETLSDDLIREARESAVRPIRIPGGSVSSLILTSKNLMMRGLGLRILENAQGGAYHGKTASILSDVNNNLIRTAEGNRFNDGFDMFLKEEGLSPLEYLKEGTVNRFNNEVYAAISQGIPSSVRPSVKLAAEGIAAKLEKALAIRKAAGEAGFEDVKSAKDYIPVLFDGPKIAAAAARHGTDTVESVIANGYRMGKFKLGAKPAAALAKMQVMRALDSTLSSRLSFERVISQADKTDFVDGLRQAGIPDHVIDNFIEGQELDELAASISSRAKASMGIDTQAEVGGVSVQSLLKTNVSEIAENYGKEAAAGAAMARMGFPTRNAVMAAVDAAERTGRNMGLPAKQVQAEAEQLRDSIKLIYGNTLDDDPNAAIVKATRRMRELTTITRLNQMGFAQIPEITRAVVKMGLGTVLKSVPSTSFLRSRSARKGGAASGMLNEPELREVEEAVGYIGEDNWLVGWATRHDEFGESPDNLSKISKVVDNALASGSRANLVLSGFKAVQGGSEKIVARSIASRLKQHLSGGKKLPQADLDEIGLNPEIMTRLQRHFDDNPRYEEYQGQQIRMLNFDAMEPDLKEAVGVGIRRMQGRLIQRHFVGDEGVWMNKWWGKALSQFKGFSIVSLEKQLIHDIRGDKVQAAQIFAWSSLLAYASYASQMQLQAIGRADREKFLEEKFKDENIAFGVFNKMPQVAAFGLGGDALGTLGLLPSSMMQAPGRLGFNQMGFGDVVPAVGMGGDYVDLMRAFSDYATGDDVSTHQLVDKVRRVVPLMNAIGIGQATKASVDLLEDQ